MGALAGRRIVLGVTGGIAAYKAVEIASRLKKAGADVRVIMTRAAMSFVTPLTFREITTIKETFVSKLLTMNHSRIAYPKLNREEATASTPNEEKREEK